MSFAPEINSLIDSYEADIKALKLALKRQCDNMAFVIDRMEVLGYCDEFTKAISEDRKLL